MLDDPQIWRAVRDATNRVHSQNDSGAVEILKDLVEHLRETPSRHRIGRLNVLSKIKKVYGLTFEDSLLINDERLPKLDQYREEARPGVSIVTCSKNRTDNLVRALASWIQLGEISEIIVVDWSSDTPVADNLPTQLRDDSRVKVVRVNGQQRWILSYAFNLGIRFASCERVIKADADILIDRDFFITNELLAGEFIAGDWRRATEGQKYINGFFYTWRDALLSIKGFNEYITTYGWDDSDIYQRFSTYGLSRKLVDTNTIRHQHHDDDARKNYEDSGPDNMLAHIRSDVEYSIQVNKHIATHMPAWGSNDTWLSFEVTTSRPNYCEVVQNSDTVNRVSSKALEAAELFAIQQRSASPFGQRVWSLNPGKLMEILASKDHDQLTDEVFTAAVERTDDPDKNRYKMLLRGHNGTRIRRKLFIDVQHGLGNRLRALASAAAVANASDRELVVVWRPDEHCQCLFSDLFDHFGAVVTDGQMLRSHDVDQWTYMEMESGACKGAWIELNPKRDAYVRSAYTLNAKGSDWDSENQFLQSLAPAKGVRLILEKLPVSMRMIGVHIRMEGGTGLDQHSYDSRENWTSESHQQIQCWRDKSHYSHFIKKIDEILVSNPDQEFFLAADRSETYGVMEERYGDRITCVHRDIYDRSRDQQLYALADAILLSRCGSLLGSNWSSFTELARRLSTRELSVKMSGIDF